MQYSHRFGKTYLLDKLGHELYNAWVVTELPDKHYDLLHLHLAFVILSEDIINETKHQKTRSLVSFIPCAM